MLKLNIYTHILCSSGEFQEIILSFLLPKPEIKSYLIYQSKSQMKH